MDLLFPIILLVEHMERPLDIFVHLSKPIVLHLMLSDMILTTFVISKKINRDHPHYEDIKIVHMMTIL